MRMNLLLVFPAILLSSCTGDDGRPNVFLTKALVLFAIGGVSILIKNLRGNAKTKTYDISSSSHAEHLEVATAEEPVMQTGVEAPVTGEEVLPSEPVSFHRQASVFRWILIAMVPLPICIVNPEIGLFGFAIFLIAALIGAHFHNEKIQEENYKTIEILSDKMVFYKEDYSDGESLFFTDITGVSLRDMYETGTYGIQSRVGTEMVFSGSEGKIWTSINYKKYKDSDDLKDVIFKRLKVKA